MNNFSLTWEQVSDIYPYSNEVTPSVTHAKAAGCANTRLYFFCKPQMLLVLTFSVTDLHTFAICPLCMHNVTETSLKQQSATCSRNQRSISTNVLESVLEIIGFPLP